MVPFAEKDAAKALGARWDAAKKIWYVKDVADLTPFLRWMAATEVATLQSANDRNAAVEPSDGIIAGPAVVAPHCGCNVLPWEDCEHTLKP